MVAHPVCYSYREYVALDDASNVKLEYLSGQIYAMAGGTPDHAALQAAVSSLLFPQLAGGRCRVFSSDLRVRVLATGLATYPDVTVVCGPRQLDPEDKNTVVNPTVIVEVLSPSTEAYDSGEKLESYKRIESLKHCVLVHHVERRVDVWTRDDEGSFQLAVARDGERATLAGVSAYLDVRALYDVIVPPVDTP